MTQLDEFRASGKPVHALVQSDMLDDLTYYLATPADRIWIKPQIAGAINGLVVESPFVRGTLEKLHVEPQVIMYKEYKRAGEMFANYEMSPYMRESLQAPIVSVVDADPSVREAVDALIRSAGWQLQTFGSAEEFLARTFDRLLQGLERGFARGCDIRFGSLFDHALVGPDLFDEITEEGTASIGVELAVSVENAPCYGDARGFTPA